MGPRLAADGGPVRRFGDLVIDPAALEAVVAGTAADLTKLRTPLATIDAYLEGLADGIRAPGQSTWDILAAQTARLRRLADDIALVSRAEEGRLPLHKTTVAPGSLMTAAVAAARPGYDARGIGLTIARALVSAHGGTITAVSDGPGTGACFTITLPARRQSPLGRIEGQAHARLG